MISWLKQFATGGTEESLIHESGKDAVVSCSARAARTLAKRERPLVIEIKFVYGCMPRKLMHFHEAPLNANYMTINPKLLLHVATIMPDVCSFSDDVTGEEIKTVGAFIPKWISIDYSDGKWVGEYGI